jgi:hypothetical protein
MPRTRTLLQLRDDVRVAADLAGLTGRHSDAQLTRAINQEIQALRSEISAVGISHFLTSATGTISAGNSTGLPYRTLDLSALSPNLTRVFGLDVQMTSQRWVTLRCVDFSERTEYQPTVGSTSSGTIPEAWANITTDTLAILPAPGSAMTYRVWILPQYADLAADGDTFSAIEGWEDRIVAGACLRCISRDQHADAYALLNAEYERFWRRILQNCSRVSAAGAVFTRKDTFSRNRRRYQWSW